MGSHHIPLPPQVKAPAFLSGTLCLGAAILGWGLKPCLAAEGGGGVLPDVLIQAEENRNVSTEKPPLDLKLKESQPLEPALQTEDDLRGRIPQEVIASTKFVTGLWNSPYVAVPSSNRIVLAWKGEPAQIFFPRQELEKVYKAGKEAKGKPHWEWVVADAAGRVFRKFSGEGMPPERLDFEGKADEGNWLKVGQVYTGVLNYADAAGRTHTAMGQSFALSGLALPKPSGYAILLAAKTLFAETPHSGRLAPEGGKLLQEAAQIIQRYHPGLSIEVAAYLSLSDGKAVLNAAQACARALEERLLAPAGKLATFSHPGTPDLDERLEINILHR